MVLNIGMEGFYKFPTGKELLPLGFEQTIFVVSSVLYHSAILTFGSYKGTFKLAAVKRLPWLHSRVFRKLD